MSAPNPGPHSFIDEIEETAIAVILGLMTLITFANVIARYVFNSNILWALELTVFLFAWMVLLGVSYAVKRNAHLGVDAVTIGFETDHLPADGEQLVRALPVGLVDEIMGGADVAARIRPDTDADAALYGSSAGIVRSDVLVALPAGEGLPLGVFAVGCRTPGHFEPAQGTELIAFLAHVTRYAVGRWWTLAL